MAASKRASEGEVIEGEVLSTSTSLAPVGQGKGQQDMILQTLSQAQVDFLLQRTPPSKIKTRQERGKTFSYVEHGYVTERLNMVFGFNWDFQVLDKIITDDEVIVEACLTVRTPGGQRIEKTQFGGAAVQRHSGGPRQGKIISLADNLKAAGSDALKKCASLLGIGLDLYRDDDPPDDGDNGSTPNEDRAPMHVQQLKGRHGAPTPPPAPPVRQQQAPDPTPQDEETRKKRLVAGITKEMARIYDDDLERSRALRKALLNGKQGADLDNDGLFSFLDQLRRIRSRGQAESIIESYESGGQGDE